MKLIKKLLKKQEGSMLSMALVILLLGGLLVVPAVHLLSTNLTANRMFDEENLELYAADAGVDFAYWAVMNDTELTLPEEGSSQQLSFPETVSGRTVNVSISNEGVQGYQITSTATGSEGTTTITSYVSISTGGASPFDYALASLGGDIVLSGQSDVESDEVLGGDIYANGDIIVSGQADVNGDASATGEIDVINQGDIQGEQTEGAPPLGTPDIDIPSYIAEAQDIECAACGTPTHSPDLSIGGFDSETFDYIVCVERDLLVSSFASATFDSSVNVGEDVSISGFANATFGNTVGDTVCVGQNMTLGTSDPVTFSGPVQIGGNLIITGQGDITFGDNLYVAGDLTISSQVTVNLGGTVYIGGSLTVDGQADMVGAETIVVEGNITLSGQSELPTAEIPLVISVNGDVTISGQNTTSAIVYAPNGNINLSGQCELYGCAVGQSITGSGQSTIMYPQDMSDRDDLPGTSGDAAGMSITTYTIE